MTDILDKFNLPAEAPQHPVTPDTRHSNSTISGAVSDREFPTQMSVPPMIDENCPQFGRNRRENDQIEICRNKVLESLR